MKKQIISIILAAIFLFLSCACLVSCAPPELAEVKDRLVWLIETAKPINDVLYGDGLLSVYDIYGFDDEYNSWFEGEDHYFYYSEIVESYRDENGDIVEQKYDSVQSIKDDAAKVYSSSYMQKINQTFFIDDYEGGHRAKYFEVTDDGGEKRFCKYNYSEPYITEENPATIYDYDTMEIVVPSSGTTLIVELQGYNEKYFDPETGDIGSGWHKVTLQFILEGGQWFLDGPSY